MPGVHQRKKSEVAFCDVSFSLFSTLCMPICLSFNGFVIDFTFFLRVLRTEVAARDILSHYDGSLPRIDSI